MLMLALLLLSACTETEPPLKEGHYSAEMETFDREGWKAFITLYVTNGKIITIEYDAKNETGFLKSWDMDYIRWMKSSLGIYPTGYMRAYSIALLNWQDPEKVHPLRGAEENCTYFKLLAKAALENSRLGHKEIAVVPYPSPTTSPR